MKKILGLDLGTNSVGWAIINSDYSIDSMGTRVFSNDNSSLSLERTSQKSYRRLQNRIDIRQNVMVDELINNQKALIERMSRRRAFKLDIKIILCISLTIIMFACAYFMKNHWQFWLNLGIGGLFILLNIDYSNKSKNGKE